MTKEHLIPIRTTKRAKELGRLGGLSKSPAKQRAARINGMRANMKISKEVAEFNANMLEGKFAANVYDLITINYKEGLRDPERRDKVIAQIQNMMPKTTHNLNLNITNKHKIIYDLLIELNMPEVYEEYQYRLNNQEGEKEW